MEFQGAEAKVTVKTDKVEKRREEKTYRHPQLDKRLRSERTSEEIRNTQRARKFGANTPEVEKKDEKTLEMEKITGKPVKECLDNNEELMNYAGENTAKMHSGDVIHGDLTTSNMMWTGEEIYIIDFGLSEISERIEDKAVDIHLLKQVLESSHPEKAEKAWEKFVEGYRELEESGKILEQLKEVESRGRYK